MRSRWRSHLSGVNVRDFELLEELEVRHLLNGAPTITGYEVNDSDAQRSRVQSILIEFSEDVGSSLDSVDLEIMNLGDLSVVSPASVAIDYDSVTQRALVTFPGLVGDSLENGNYRITLLASGILDLGGQMLDGNRDGRGGDDYVFNLFRLFGDKDGDRDNDFADLFRFRSSFQQVDPSPDYDLDFDADADGDVDFLDLFNYRGTFQTVLPADIAAEAELNQDTGAAGDDGLTFDPTVNGRIAFHQDAAAVRVGVDQMAIDDFVDISVTLLDNGTLLLDRQALEAIAGGALDDGDHTVHVRAEDEQGELVDAATLAFTLDTVGPTAPGFSLEASSRAEPNNPALTTADTVDVVGQSDANLTVEFTPIGQSTQTDGAGNFAVNGIAVKPGLNPIVAAVEDLAGNVNEFALSIARIDPPATDLTLTENTDWLVERSMLIDLGQAKGSRSLTFNVEPTFDGMDDSLVGDLFQVYLVDPVNPGATLLDRGREGEALFSLGESGADFLPGLVRFDGTTVTVDLTSLQASSEGLLVFQLINGDADEGTSVAVSNVGNTVDPDGVASPVFLPTTNLGQVGDAVDLSTFSTVPSDDIEVLIDNVRVDGEAGQYLADLRVRNAADPVARTLVARFNGLPANVTLTNASGVDSAGRPFVNLAPAIASGGLDRAATSLPIELIIDNPNLERFEVDIELLSSGPNQAPVFDPIADQTMLPGGVLSIPLQSTDPNGDSVTFSLAGDLTPGSLPATRLDVDQITFTPTPDQVGTYTVTVRATDGLLNTDRTFTLTVEADPITTTRISGTVMSTEGVPLPGVPVSLGRLIIHTDADGHFEIELPSTLVPTESFDIEVPQGDIHFDPFGTGTETIELHRSGYDTQTGSSVNNPRRHPNLVTSFIDAGVVYGSDADRAAALRTFSGGRLKSQVGPDGELLPLNNTTFFPNGVLENDNAGGSDPTTLFVAGDVRASENPALTALHTILLREHNRLADEIAAADPNLSDEQIYQQARRLVGALIQHITYNEYLPLLVGPNAIPAYTGYDANTDPSTGAFFTTVAFRIGHSQAVAELLRLDAMGNPVPEGPLSTREAFFNSEPILSDGIEPFLNGMTTQIAEEIDVQVIDELRSFLFGPPGSGGLDLPAMTIQRGRDLGLPSYNQARADYGLAPVTSFAEITSDTTVQANLASVYATVDDVDAFVGGVAEDHVAGAQVGELFQAAIADQFQASRDGDRFWYENEQFTSDELTFIRGTTLGALLERNSDLTSLPTSVLTSGAVPPAPAPGGSAATQPVTEHRSVDGTDNNQTNSQLGSTGEHLRIDASLNYADGISEPIGGDRPSAREVSNAILAQSATNLSADGLTTMAVFWGQLLSHDLALTPTGITDTIRFHGDAVSGNGTAYPFVAEKIDLLLDRDLSVGVNNVIARPIYLPALDIAGGTLIDPAVDTMVMQEIAPGEMASILIAAGSLLDRDGLPFDDVLSITEVPADFTPIALPDNLLLDTVVTIQPAEMVFTTPAQLTLPNRANYEPGTLLDLWSINPITGQFEIVGTMQVSADGSAVETISGGIINTSWSGGGPTLDQVPDPDEEDENQDEECEKCEATADATSEVELHSGAVRESHRLISYQSLGVDRSLTLHYDSQRASPRPILHFGIDNANGRADRFLVVRLSFTNGSVTHQVDGFAGGMGLSGGEHFWRLPTGINNIKTAIQADLSSLPSGVYEYTLTRGVLQFNSGRFNGTTNDSTGQIVHVNTIDSPFGTGWQLAGIQRIVETSDGSVLFIDGDGTNVVFVAPDTVGDSYQAPVGDFSVLVKNIDGTYTRTMADQTVHKFDATGRVVSVTDRKQNTTQYVYDSATGRLGRIIDPIGLETVFRYNATGRVNEIEDPAGRVTMLEYDTQGNLTRLTDPDLSTRSFDYDSRHNLIAEVDQNGNREQTLYGFHGRAIGAIRKNGSSLSFDPVQVRLLHPAELTRNPTTAPLASFVPAETVAWSTDAHGGVTTTILDKAGQAISRADSQGTSPSVNRNDDNLVQSITDARSHVTEFTYDTQGNLLTLSDDIVNRSSSVGALFDGRKFRTGDGPHSIISADFNNDGVLDVAVANDGSNDVSVLLGHDDGSFGTQIRTAVGDGARSVVSIDFNGDGILDLAVANYSSNDVSILLGNGDGTFQPDQRIATGTAPRSIAIADFNGDGMDDLAVSHYKFFSFGGFIQVLLGNGDGSFTDGQVIGGSFFTVATGDINGDGNTDIAAARYSSDQVSVSLGNGDGTFFSPQSFAAGNRPWFVTLGDFDGDGFDDVAVSNRNSRDVSVLLSNGDGTLVNQQRLAVGNCPFGLAAVDIDGDDDVDLVSTNESSNDVSVLLGNGDGSFAAQQQFAVANGPHSVAIADVTSDGTLDLLVATTQSDDFAVLVGNGDGTFGARSRANIASDVSDWGFAVSAADFNNDETIDLIVTKDRADVVSVLLGNGDGTFGDAVDYVAGDRPVAVTVADFNGDGIQDAVVTNHDSNDAHVFLGNGDGSLGTPIRIPGTVFNRPVSVTATDFDGDGVTDLAIASQYESNQISVWLGNGNGTFEFHQRFNAGIQPVSVVVADVDGDDIADLITGNRGSSDVSVLLGIGDGTFAAEQRFAADSSPRAVTVADFNGDGDIDVAVSNGNADNVSVLLGNGDGTLADAQNYRVGDLPRSIASADFNGDGVMDVATVNYSHDVSVLLGIGDGAFADEQRFDAGRFPNMLTTEDIDGDGIADIAVTPSANYISILFSNGGPPPGGLAEPRVFTYDSDFNQLTSITDELGRHTFFELDPTNGNTVAQIRVIGDDDRTSAETDDLVTSFTYLANGLVDTIADPLNRVTDYDYNPLGQLTHITFAVGTADEATQQFEYDAAGNVKAFIDDNSSRTEYLYDSMNRLRTITEPDPDGAGPLTSPVTTFDYDARGNLTEMIDAQGNRVTNDYDSLDRLSRTVQVNPTEGDSETTFAYDLADNLRTVTDPNNHTTRFTYDGRNRRVTSTDPDGGVTRFRYDSVNNLTSLVDPNGNPTVFSYDARSRLTREVDPLGADILYDYDAVNNLRKTTDRNGRVTEFEYDDVDRLELETWLNADGSTANTVDYTYDKASNLRSVFDTVSSLTFTYDDRDRLKTVDNAGTFTAEGLPNVVLDYIYDDVGNVLSVSEMIGGAAGAVTGYQYDALNRMTQVAQTEATGATPDSVTDKRVDFGYNQLGQFTSIDRYSDLTGTQLVIGSSFVYDDLNRLMSMRHDNAGDSAVAFYDFDYDTASRITAITDIDGRTDYTYDDRDQLTVADRDAADTRGDENYSYDANGNRTDSHLHSTDYVTGPGNRLLSDGTYDYDYDDEGNMILRTETATGAVRQFEWDHRNRLRRVTDRASAAGVITNEATYTYDALDRRIAKTVDADGEGAAVETTEHYVYDGIHVLLEFTDGDGSGSVDQPVLSVRNLFGPGVDQVLAQEVIASAQTRWLLADHLGTVRDIVDDTSSVLNHILYDSYGNVISQTDSLITTRYLFTGREFDVETGLYYYRARYYDAGIGRFISEDPIGFVSGDFNLTRYVSNVPITFVDPFGNRRKQSQIRHPLESQSGGGGFGRGGRGGGFGQSRGSRPPKNPLDELSNSLNEETAYQLGVEIEIDKIQNECDRIRLLRESRLERAKRLRELERVLEDIYRYPVRPELEFPPIIRGLP